MSTILELVGEGDPCGKFKIRCTECRAETVVAIGGCNRMGECGVRAAEGSITKARLPVVGATVNVCRQKE